MLLLTVFLQLALASAGFAAALLGGYGVGSLLLLVLLKVAPPAWASWTLLHRTTFAPLFSLISGALLQGLDAGTRPPIGPISLVLAVCIVCLSIRLFWSQVRTGAS